MGSTLFISGSVSATVQNASGTSLSVTETNTATGGGINVTETHPVTSVTITDGGNSITIDRRRVIRRPVVRRRAPTTIRRRITARRSYPARTRYMSARNRRRY